MTGPVQRSQRRDCGLSHAAIGVAFTTNPTAHGRHASLAKVMGRFPQNGVATSTRQTSIETTAAPCALLKTIRSTPASPATNTPTESTTICDRTSAPSAPCSCMTFLLSHSLLIHEK